MEYISYKELAEKRNMGYREHVTLSSSATPLFLVFAKPKAIKNVIFNDPATIVFWTDGTKTVVKCQEGDIYDPEKGLAMALTKKMFGNKGNYRKVYDEWLPEEKTDAKSGLIGKVKVEIGVDSAEFEKSIKKMDENLRKVGKSIKKMEESLNRCDAILGE